MPLFEGIVALNAVLRLDVELDFFQFIHELVYLRVVFDRGRLQGLQLRTQVRVFGLQVALHAGTVPGLKPLMGVRLSGLPATVVLGEGAAKSSACVSSSIRGPY